MKPKYQILVVIIGILVAIYCIISSIPSENTTHLGHSILQENTLKLKNYHQIF